MADRSHADRATVVFELIDDPIGPDAQRPQTVEPPAQLVATVGLPLKQPESIVDRDPQGPPEIEQRESSAAYENYPRHESTGFELGSSELGGPKLSQLLPHLLERDRSPQLALGPASFDRRHRILVGKDLSRFLQRLVLVNRHDRRSRSAVTGNDHVIAPIGHVAEHLRKVVAKLPHGHRLGHRRSVPHCVPFAEVQSSGSAGAAASPSSPDAPWKTTAYLRAGTPVVHSQIMATSHPRIQVTEDPELARALRSAASHLPSGLSRSRQVRELAIAGARHLAEEPPSEEQRGVLLERLTERFMKPETAGIDWDLLRDGKLRAWPIP
jgi:hypothetical protein